MSRDYPKLNQRHIGVMVWLLEHPCSTLTECAKNTGYSRSWLSRIVNAPEFKAEYNKQMEIELSRAVKRNLGQTPKINYDNFKV